MSLVLGLLSFEDMPLMHFCSQRSRLPARRRRHGRGSGSQDPEEEGAAHLSGAFLSFGARVDALTFLPDH